MNLLRPLLTGPCLALALLAGCSTAYTNQQSCLEQVHTWYNSIGQLPLKISNVSVATGGSRVVVEGEVLAPAVKKDLLKTLAAAPEKLLAAKSATGASAASAASGASSAAVVSAPRVPAGNAAAECVFASRQLTLFHWLTPAAMVATNSHP